MTITLTGPIPAKKNRWRNYGRLPLKERGEIEALCWQMVGQRRTAMAPLPANTVMVFEIQCRNPRADRDNMYTTILDCLVKCEILSDDSTIHMNGFHLLAPVSVSRSPITRIHILDPATLSAEAFANCGLFSMVAT